MARNDKAAEAARKMNEARIRLERERPRLLAEIAKLEEDYKQSQREFSAALNDLSNWV
jgi:hypothetical protein